MSGQFSDIDPAELGGEQALTPVVEEAQPESLEAFFPEINLQTALMFVPDVRMKREAERLADALLSIQVKNGGEDGLKVADEAIAPLRRIVAEIESKFQGTRTSPGPTAIIFSLHRRLTGLCNDFCARAKQAIETKNKEIAIERKRLDDEIERDRQRRQAEADAEVRNNAAQQLEQAIDTGASKESIKALKSAAKTGVAAPVGAAAPPPLKNSTVVEKKRVRFKGVADHEDPHPKTKEFTKDQAEKARLFFKAVAEGWVPLIAASIEWGELDKLANGQGATFEVPPGMEVFDDSKARSKGRPR